MPLYLSRAHSGRITKSQKTPTFQRSQSLPFPVAKRVRTLERTHSALQEDESHDSTAATAKDVTEISITVLEKANVKDVVSAVKYVRETMFETLPDRAGMNSVKIAEVLNFQRNMPSLVTMAHVHALRTAASRTEREVSDMLNNNTIRRIKLVGRGNEISGLGEVLLTTEHYAELARNSGLPEEVVLSFLQEHCKSYILPKNALPRKHIDLLLRHGFLVVPSISNTEETSTTRSHTVVSSVNVSRSASGTQAAVGGEAAFEVLGMSILSSPDCPPLTSPQFRYKSSSSMSNFPVGGVNGVRKLSSPLDRGYNLSVPGIAAYVRLLKDAREHLLDLLRQFSKYRQAPLYLLKERWNGNVDDDENQVSVARRVRGEFSNVSAARTKKWRAFKGLSFDWIIEECFGAGLIELFETGSVGLGVRSLV